MAVLTLPGTDQLANWSAFQADGITPSAAIALVQDNVSTTPSGDSRSVGISLAAASLNHRARCSVAAQDLSEIDELRLALRSDRPASGSFFVELRLGSAALAIGAPGNLWHRRLPLSGGNRWDVIRLSLDDLPAAVRGALTVIELQCLDDSRPCTLRLDEVLAVRPRMLADLEQALLARLHLQFTLGGNPVPALAAAAGAALPVQRPCIAVLPLQLRQAQERSTAQPQRCDHVEDGYRLRPAPLAWEVGYAIEPLANTRAEQSALLDWLTGTLPAQGSLRVGGQLLNLEHGAAPELAQELLPVPVPRQWLTYRAWAWQDMAAALPVRPTEEVVTTTDWKEPSHA
jgi:hypothetical protein